MDNGSDNEVMELIEMLYTMVSEAWGVPLGNDKCIVEREKVLSLLEEIKARLPVELSEAKRLVSARDEFIGNAKREAESIRRLAEEKARAMVEEQEIVRVSRARANELVTTADNKSRELRRVANEYVDDAMRRTEEAVAAALDEIHQYRGRFRGAAGLATGSTSPQARPQQIQTMTEEDFN
jgi:cell division septum initiation protein DivIVA